MVEAPPGPPDADNNAAENPAERLTLKRRINDANEMQVRAPGETWRAPTDEELDAYEKFDEWKRLNPGQVPPADVCPILFENWTEEDDLREAGPAVDAAKAAVQLEADTLRSTGAITAQDHANIVDALVIVTSVEEADAVTARLRGMEQNRGAGARGARQPERPQRARDERQMTPKERGEERAAYERAMKAAEKAEKETTARAALQARKDAVKVRFEKLRVAGTITGDTAAELMHEVDVATTDDAIKNIYEERARYYEAKSSTGAERPANARKNRNEGADKVKNDREFVELVVEATKNINAIANVGGDVNALYARYRRRLDTADLKDFDDELKKEELLRGTPYGIRYGSAAPADRWKRTKVDTEPQPEWAGNYLGHTDGRRHWMSHDSKKYGELVPFTMEEIRSDPKKQQLFGELMTAVNPSQEIYEFVSKDVPLNAAQRQFLDYCQYEFTHQYQRAQMIEEIITPELIETLTKRSTFLERTRNMSGTTRMHEYFKDDIYHVAMRDRGLLDRYAAAARELNQIKNGSWYQSKDDRMQRREIAQLMEYQLKETELRQKMEKEALTGERNPMRAETGAQNADQARQQKQSVQDELSSARMQAAFDRDKVKDNPGWKWMSPPERAHYRDHVWNPPEAKKHTEGEGKGFWAQLARALARVLFAEEKKKVATH